MPSNPKTHDDHDQLFKKLITEFFPDFIKLVRPQLAGRLLLEKATFEQQELFTEPTAISDKFEADLVARVPTTDHMQSFILTHVEVEARKKGDMARRLWRYNMMLQLREDLAVLPIVVYIKGGPSQIGAKTHRVQVLDEVVCEFRYFEVGLSRMQAEAYLAREEPLAWALAALMKPTKSRVETRLACTRRILLAPLPERARRLLYDCVEQYLVLKEEERAQYQALLNTESNSKVKEVVMTWSEQIEARGEAKGEARGEARGLQSSLLTVLSARFGSVPQPLEQRLQADQNGEHLRQLLTTAATAPSLSEFEAALG